MTTIRIKKSANYSVIHNTPINDKNLSCESLGVLTYLLSKPDGWVVRNHEIRQRFNLGRDKLARIFNELAKAGYMERIKTRSDSGRWIWDTTINEHGTIDGKPVDGKPVDGKPNDGKPNDGKHVDIVKTESVSTESVSTERENALPKKDFIVEFVPLVQTLLKCNPQDSGFPIQPEQQKIISELCHWLITTGKATIAHIKVAIKHFAWMSSPPQLWQIKTDWSAICTEVNKLKPKPTNLTQSQLQQLNELNGATA